jgi:imidazolonepropionase-like amidohydrolase
MNPDLEIRCGWLIDGTGRDPVQNAVISVKDGLIISAGKSDRPVPEGELTGLRSFTVLPWLADCHVHLSWSGTTDPGEREAQFVQNYASAKEKIKQNLEDSLRHGVLYVRDGGDSKGHALRYRNEIHKKHLPFASCAGKGFYKPGRYGRLVGSEIHSVDEMISIIKNTPGIGHIKLVNSGINSLNEFGRQTRPQFTKEELEAAVKAADSMDLSVMVHANGEIPVKLAVEAGCASIEHGFFMGKDNMKRMADSGTFWIPTAFTMKAYSENNDPGSTKSQIAKKNLDHQLGQISLAKEFGVRIALGTDAGGMGIFHGRSVYEEMALFLEAGLTPGEAVKCASENAALLLGLSDAGTLLPGKKAGFTAIPGAPDNLLKNLNSGIRVFINGKELNSK